MFTALDQNGTQAVSVSLRTALCHSVDDSSLRILSNAERISPFVLDLPREKNLLLPIVGCLLGNAETRHDRQKRHLYDEGTTYMDLAHAYSPDFPTLAQCADDERLRDPVRTAAILMATLHPRGGIQFALDRRPFLVAHAESPKGASLAGAFGLCVDIHSAEEQAPVRVMLSALLEATRAHLAEPPAFNALLTRWLARSRTPANRAGVFDAWLRAPELAKRGVSDTSLPSV